jgi:ABC-type branched-subunit amino acid transport system ATPase component
MARSSHLVGALEQNAVIAPDVASRRYVLETGTVALADDTKALLRNEQVRKTYLAETD